MRRVPHLIPKLLPLCILLGVLLFGRADLHAAAANDLFADGTLIRLSIEISPTNMASLRKAPRGKVRATITEGGRVYPHVGIHLKGALGSFRQVDDKPAFSLDFNAFVPKQRFHGVRKLLLNNMVQDATCLNDKIAGELFRAAKVPTARSSHALVELNGRKLGLYLLREAFGKDFLAANFTDDDGAFYDLNHGSYELGNVDELQRHFRLDSGKGPPGMSDIAALILACKEKDASQRWKRLNAVLDVETFLSFMAAEVLTCHVDGYTMYGNNYRLYHNPRTDKLVFIPNDFDRMFNECRGSLLNPGFSASAARAVYDSPEGNAAYKARCAFICTNVFNLASLTNRANGIAERLSEQLKQDDPHAAELVRKGAATIGQRLRQRAALIEKEFRK